MRIPIHRLAKSLAVLCWLSLLWTSAHAGDNPDDAPPADRLERVSIEGLSGTQAENVRLLLSIRRLVDQDGVTEAQIRFRHAQAEAEIAEALQPFGYYHSSVDAQLEQDGASFRATYRISRGKPTRVRELDIRIGEQQTLASRFPLATGDILDHRSYESGKNDITRQLRQMGYFDQRISRQRVEVRRQDHSARIILHFDTGTRYRFGVTEIRGSQVDERLVRRAMLYEPGEPFRQDLLNQLQRDLAETTYFSEVLVSTELSRRKDHQVPIVIELQPGRRRAYNAGVTLGTDSGIGVEGGFAFRWLNQRGHSIKAEASASQLATRFGADYRIPDMNRRGSGYTIGVSRVREDSDSALRTTSRATFGRFGLWSNDWQWVARLALQRESFTVAGIEGQSDLVVPELIVSQKRADDIMRPRRGHSYHAELRGGASSLGSDTSFLQTLLRGRWILPVASDDRLLLSTSVGTTNVSRIEDLPASFRFFTGGDRTVRGFAFQALGPLDQDGQVIGGKHLFTASSEYERRFGENWGMAAFVDTGNALNRFGDDLEISTGLGFRYFSPLGPIRFDVAQTLTDSTLGERDWRIHFTVGPDL